MSINPEYQRTFETAMYIEQTAMRLPLKVGSMYSSMFHPLLYVSGQFPGFQYTRSY